MVPTIFGSAVYQVNVLVNTVFASLLPAGSVSYLWYGERLLEFPNYDGNGQFRSLGNVLINPNVSLLFIDFETPNRLRVQGHATLGDDLTVCVEVTRLWPNCPRYIHRMRFESLSPHAPRDGHEPPDAEWKQYFTDVLPCTPPS
jgi:hypothetical protein